MKNIPILESLNALSQFAIQGESIGCIPFGNGHINDTLHVLTEDEQGGLHDYVLQSVNRHVFPEAERVNENIAGISCFLKQKRADKRTVLSMVPLRNGGYSYVDEKNRCWRVTEFIEHALCLDRPESKDDFYQCALAFGRFQQDLADYPVDTLFEPIANFHNTPQRFQNFLKALEKNASGRADQVADEIAFVKAREAFCHVLQDAEKAGRLPLRVTHNDTKSNNVMLDEATHEALCVIDLDTVMPGYSVNDFGDAIRFGASTAAEDEKDLSKVRLSLDMFDAYARGYLEGCAGSLDEDEVMLLPEGAKMMTLECGMRFLTDYLDGDVYFKCAYPEHNLDRCRTQFKLVAEMEAHWDEMKDIVRRYL